jgi:hypothetical protein
MNSAVKLAFGSVLLSSLAWAQAPSQPPVSEATSSVALAGENGLKAVRPTAADARTDIDPDMIVDPASLVPDLPPIPGKKTTLIGGTVEHLDRVRDQVTVRVFGGGRMKILFDPRTKVYRGSTEAKIADLRQGDRIYLDTLLDGDTVFARSIRLKTTVQAVGESQGVVLKYGSQHDELTIRDVLSPTPIHVHLSSSTRFLQGGQAVSANVLSEGCLVAVSFGSEGAGHDVAQEITILAMPGSQYTFAGQIVHLDLRTGLVVIKSSTDQKTYDVYLDPSVAPNDNLHAGAVITVITNFDGSRYTARGLTIVSQAK